MSALKENLSQGVSDGRVKNTAFLNKKWNLLFLHAAAFPNKKALLAQQCQPR